MDPSSFLSSTAAGYQVETAIIVNNASDESDTNPDVIPANNQFLASSVSAQDMPSAVDASVLERSCWVCFAGEDEEPNLRWLRPCRCRGSTKWVHYDCLQRWIDSQQKGTVTLPVACPQCGAYYLLKFGDVGMLHKALDKVERTINKTCPYLAGICLVGATYWTAVSYGALTVMQVLGHREGLQLMERSDPLILLIALPTIPAGLVWGKMLRWEDYVARNWQWFLHFVCPYVFKRPTEEFVFAEQQNSPSRILCGALVFPTVATLIGRFLLGRVKSNLERTVLGGTFFIAIKGILRIYYKLKHNEQYQKREIMDAPETRDADTQATGDGAY